ncbi:pheromone-processing carboxypeptidase kex1 [Elsinoe australis]|uniref:Pheromone-processing carboxypeptidase KEX1 n=1 Tax=Elsinoe australis TaxID=40998 RepID=A0A4U7B0Z5_9PEZI|nr:pheromone-processing carboxypeptidase kex1 [Elsinoe australis]
MAPNPTSQRQSWLSIPRLLHTSLLLFGTSWLPATLAQQQKSAADYFVKHLPGAPTPLLKMHAGHIEINPEHHGNLFFWHFANKHIGDRQRTVLWLNGGPGCSSMDGAMMEVGPYKIKGENLEYRDGSWDEYANLLFVDQPVGTGFSYVDTDSFLHELDEVAKNMVTFLDKWFALFPQYLDDDLYIAGESFAGQYIPYIAKAILDRNQNARQVWNLKGLLIGNGWISGEDQYLSYLPYAYKEKLITEGSEWGKKLETQHNACQKTLEQNGNDAVHIQTCELILNELLRATHEDPKMNKQCINMYDIRKTDTYESCGMNWPPDLEYLSPYLRRKDVLFALHVDQDKKTGWKECNDQVGVAFTAANSKSAITILPELLSKIPIALFSGDRDLICNHLGTEALINNLSFNDGKGFETSPGVTAPRLDWMFGGEEAGYWQEARNLTYILFYNSSHMVPFDYTLRSRFMLDTFMGVNASSATWPGDTWIDGQKPSSGVVGNATDVQKEKEKVDQARWDAYYRSGEVALVVVLIAAGVWGWFVLRQRRSAKGYKGLFDGGGGPSQGANGGLMGKGKGRRDVEAADFDEAELDELTDEGRFRDEERERFDVGSESDSDGEVVKGKANGHR